MDLSIAINSFKNPDLLRLCLDSIKKNVRGINFEIIVADGATEEATEMMMREDFPDVRFFPFKENVGFQALLNKGIAESRGKYLLLLNGDIIVTENSVERMLEYLGQHKEIGMIGPKQLNFDNSLQYSCFRFYDLVTILYRRTFLGKMPFAKKHLDWFLMKDYDHKDPKEVDWLLGSALMVSREAIEKVGPMDKRFFMYMEDVDWCRRFWENGLKVIYFPFSEMYHYHGKGSGKGGFLHSIFRNRLTWVHIASAIKYFWKYRRKEAPKHN